MLSRQASRGGHLPKFWSGGRTLTATNRITRRCGRIKGDLRIECQTLFAATLSSHSSNPFLGASNSHRSPETLNKAYVSLNKRPCDVTNRQLAPFPVQSVRRQRSGRADGRADLNHRELCAYKSSGFKSDLHLSIKQKIQQFWAPAVVTDCMNH